MTSLVLCVKIACFIKMNKGKKRSSHLYCIKKLIILNVQPKFHVLKIVEFYSRLLILPNKIDSHFDIVKFG